MLIKTRDRVWVINYVRMDKQASTTLEGDFGEGIRLPSGSELCDRIRRKVACTRLQDISVTRAFGQRCVKAASDCASLSTPQLTACSKICNIYKR